MVCNWLDILNIHDIFNTAFSYTVFIQHIGEWTHFSKGYMENAENVSGSSQKQLAAVEDFNHITLELRNIMENLNRQISNVQVS